MAQDSRGKWTVFSGLTRSEQKVLLFLIGVMGAGLVYQEWTGRGHDEVLSLRRGASGPIPVADDPDPSSLTEPLDINTATVGEIEALPQIGPSLADAIVKYRAMHGPFRRIDDLDQVPGIGAKTIEGLRPYLQPLAGEAAATLTITPAFPLPRTLAGPVEPQPTPNPLVNINTATEEELCTLVGVKSALAKRIIEYRRTHGPFRSVAELDRVRGIGPTILGDNRDRLTVGAPRR